jgi:hypothetical protein
MFLNGALIVESLYTVGAFQVRHMSFGAYDSWFLRYYDNTK